MVETRYENNNGTTENVRAPAHRRSSSRLIALSFQCHKLAPDELAVRKLEYLDIAVEPVPDYKYKESEDPCKYKSEKTGRGPLTSTWRVSVSSIALSPARRNNNCSRNI